MGVAQPRRYAITNSMSAAVRTYCRVTGAVPRKFSEEDNFQDLACYLVVEYDNGKTLRYQFSEEEYGG